MTLICRNPFVPPGLKIAVGCGQCGPCRAKRQMTWVHRIMLEALDHKDNSFWSLSYSDEHLKSVDAVPSLNRTDYVLFLKKLRNAFEPLKFRFFIVGEYGETKWRPHYHLILFGFPRCNRGQTLRDPVNNAPDAANCCQWCRMVHEKWGMGNVFGGDLTSASARYCAAYTLKKMTMPDDPRLAGRHPEFAQFSRRPGLGVNAMFDVASVMMEEGLDSNVDVPTFLRHGRSLMPLGRTLRGKLRNYIGREDETPPEVLKNLEEEMSLMRLASFNDSVPFRETVKMFSDQDYANWEARRLLYKQGKDKI